MDTLETKPPSNGSTGEKTLSASPAGGGPRSARAAIASLKVSATSKPVAVAGAIAGVIRSQSRVEVQAIGAGAINQAIKAIAISRGYVAPGGLDIVCIPSFIDISITGEAPLGSASLLRDAENPPGPRAHVPCLDHRLPDERGRLRESLPQASGCGLPGNR